MVQLACDQVLESIGENERFQEVKKSINYCFLIY